jgi:hypothetical protein
LKLLDKFLTNMTYVLSKINKTLLTIIDHPTIQRIKVYVMVLVILAIFTYCLLTLNLRIRKVEEREIIKEKSTVTITLQEFQEMKRKERK